jgi:hypothetical protein
LEGLEIPEQVETLLIFADKDANKRGEHAARALESRVSSRMDVRILLPMPHNEAYDGQIKGVDWLDVMNTNANAWYDIRNQVNI